MVKKFLQKRVKRKGNWTRDHSVINEI